MLSLDLVFDYGQAQNHQHIAYLLNFKHIPQLNAFYFRITEHHHIEASRNQAIG